MGRRRGCGDGGYILWALLPDQPTREPTVGENTEAHPTRRGVAVSRGRLNKGTAVPRKEGRTRKKEEERARVRIIITSTVSAVKANSTLIPAIIASTNNRNKTKVAPYEKMCVVYHMVASPYGYIHTQADVPRTAGVLGEKELPALTFRSANHSKT